VGSEYEAPDMMTNFDEKDERVLTNLQEDIPTRQRISRAYFF
jgi:DNA-binding Lrp family transcriptional regulator